MNIFNQRLCKYRESQLHCFLRSLRRRMTTMNSVEMHYQIQIKAKEQLKKWDERFKRLEERHTRGEERHAAKSTTMHSNWLEALRLHEPDPKKTPHRHQNRGRQALNIVRVHITRVGNFMKYNNQVKISSIAQHEGITRVTRTNKGRTTWSNIRHTANRRR